MRDCEINWCCFQIIFTARKRRLGQGNAFTGVCQSFGGACLPLGPGISASGSRVRCTTGSRWVCLYVVVHTLLDTHPDTHSPRTHTDPWTQPPHTHPRQTHTHTLDPPPRSTNGRYASYWNSFLFELCFIYLWVLKSLRGFCCRFVYLLERQNDINFPSVDSICKSHYPPILNAK